MHTAKKSTPLLTRRQFLRVGLAGGAVLLTARLVYGPFARMRLAEVPEAEQLKTLNPRTATALAAIAPVMLGSAFPPAEPEETRLGAQHALVVYGRDGLDEISLGAGTLVGELKDGVVREYEIHPEDYGLRMAGTRALRVDSPEQSRAMLLAVLQGSEGPARDIVCLNAGAALYAANVVPSMAEGLQRAQQALASGAALAKLHELVAHTQKLAA